jgi:hypothetical protein
MRSLVGNSMYVPSWGEGAITNNVIIIIFVVVIVTLITGFTTLKIMLRDKHIVHSQNMVIFLHFTGTNCDQPSN